MAFFTFSIPRPAPSGGTCFLPQFFLKKIFLWLPVQRPHSLRKLCGEFLGRPPGVAVELEPPLCRDAAAACPESRADLLYISARGTNRGRSSAVLSEGGSERPGNKIRHFQAPRARPPQLSCSGLRASSASSSGARPATCPSLGSCVL